MVEPRRVLVMLGVLLLVGKGAQGVRNLLARLLLRGDPKTVEAAAAPAWRLFSTLLKDLSDKKVSKVLLAADYCVVHAKDSVETYKCVIEVL